MSFSKWERHHQILYLWVPAWDMVGPIFFVKKLITFMSSIITVFFIRKSATLLVCYNKNDHFIINPNPVAEVNVITGKRLLIIINTIYLIKREELCWKEDKIVLTVRCWSVVPRSMAAAGVWGDRPWSINFCASEGKVDKPI